MLGRVTRHFVAAAAVLASLVGAAAAQSRVALVIGNSAYQGVPALPTATGDASIVAETMRGAGYDVIEVRDVRLADIGQVMRDFLDKVAAAGPDGTAFVYYSGYGAQSEGENFIVPIDAAIADAGDVPYQALQLNDLLRELTALPAAARVIVLDASRDHGFGRGTSAPVPRGLALMDVPAGVLIASSAAPGALSIDGDDAYSIYTTALVTFMRQPGLELEQIFKATRLQVNKSTRGAQTPWMVSNLDVEVRLFDQPAPAAAAAPPAPPQGLVTPPRGDRVVTKDFLRGLPPDEAYQVAIEEDALEIYQWFVELFPRHALVH